MKLSKLNRRSPLEHHPQSKKLAQKHSLRNFLVKSLVGLLVLYAVYWLYAHSEFIHSFIDPLLSRIKLSLHKFYLLTKWNKFWLLAPAILFDSTRYYLTNSIVFFAFCFKKLFPFSKPHPFEDPSKCPLVSVIIPMYNEGKTIRHTLDSILDNNYPNYEVIIVDDCSSDATSLICKKYQKEGKINYLRKTQRGGKPAALNYGLNFAKGEIVIHFDGDSIFYRDTIFEAIKPFADPKVGAVAGNLKVMNDRASLPARLQAAEYGMSISVQRRWLSMSDTLQIASGAFGCFRKKILQNLKGTDPEVGEDSDITLKVRKMGYKVLFAPKAISFTDVPDNWKALSIQRILWDRCYIRVNLRKHFNIANFRNFRFGDFLAVMTDIIFNLFLLLVFPIYITIIAIYFRPLLLYILVVTYLYYTLMQFVQFLIVVLLSETKKRDSIFLLYAPIFFLYSCYLRVIRGLAYFLEIFRSNRFKKGYFPEKIWKSMPEHW